MIPQRDRFDGPARLQQVWVLRKESRGAVCEVWSHVLGYELRLTADGSDFPRTQVCRSTEELVTVQASWRSALEEQGWAKLT